MLASRRPSISRAISGLPLWIPSLGLVYAALNGSEGALKLFRIVACLMSASGCTDALRALGVSYLRLSGWHPYLPIQRAGRPT